MQANHSNCFLYYILNNSNAGMLKTYKFNNVFKKLFSFLRKEN